MARDESLAQLPSSAALQICLSAAFTMAVNRCICANVPFTELKNLADAGIRDLEELARRTNCGKDCGMCIPYIRVMLATGETDLPILNQQQINALQPPPAEL